MEALEVSVFNGSPAPHREEVVNRLILRIQSADESEEVKLAILHLFRNLIRHRDGEISSPDRALIASQNVLQDARLSEQLRTWAFSNRSAFLATLQSLAPKRSLDPDARECSRCFGAFVQGLLRARNAVNFEKD